MQELLTHVKLCRRLRVFLYQHGGAWLQVIMLVAVLAVGWIIAKAIVS